MAKRTKKAGKKATTRKATRKTSSSRASGKKRKATKRGRQGRPPFKPTEEQLELVESYAGILKQSELCQLVVNPATGKPIDEKTLRIHFGNILREGLLKKNGDVGNSLYLKAIGDGPQAATAAIWWSKCMMGWKERVAVDVDVKSGVLVAPAAMTPEQWVAAAAAKNAARKAEEGGEDA